MSLSSINEAQIRGAATRGTKVLDHLYMVYSYVFDKKLASITNIKL